MSEAAISEWTIIAGFAGIILTILVAAGGLAGVVLAGQAGIHRRIDDLRTEMTGRLDRMDNRLDRMDSRLDAIELHMRGLDNSVSELRGYVARRNDLFPDITPAE